MPSLRRWAARALDVAAVLIVVAAVARFVVYPRLHGGDVPAPAVRIAALQGPSFDTAARHRGVVFLDFWATWCEPCRDSIPLVQRFARAHPGIDVISVDVGEPAVLVRPFARQFAMQRVGLDPDAVASHAFGVAGFPTLVAIDPASHVHVVGIGFDAGVERAMADAVKRYGNVKRE